MIKLNNLKIQKDIEFNMEWKIKSWKKFYVLKSEIQTSYFLMRWVCGKIFLMEMMKYYLTVKRSD